MQFKRLAAIAGSALMAGMTIAAPVLASTVSQVNQIGNMVDATHFPLFVVGKNAQPSDVVGAINIATKLASYSKTTETVTTSAGTSESVVGGVKIRTPGNELTPYTAIQSVKSVLTSSDLDILADGTFQTINGGTYQYKQYLYLSGDTTETTYNKVVFEKPTTENDPVINFKATANRNLTTYKLTFSTPVALGSSVDTNSELQAILQGTTINILGKDFVISDCTSTASNVIDSITLIGGKNTVTMKSGEDKTITIDGKDYVVHLDAVVDESTGGSTYKTAVGDINGESFTLRQGNTFTMSDGTLVAAIKVLQGKTGEADYVKIAVGADKIKLTAGPGGTVTKGTKTVSDLTSEFSATGSNGWSWMKITYKPSTDIFVKEGEKITDPFAETFDIKFEGITPAFDDTTNRQTIKFSPSSYNMMLNYKNANGDTEELYTLYYDSGTYRWMSSSVSATNQDNGYRDVVFDEYQNISAIEQDYFIVSKSGFSHVLQFTSFTPATSELVFTDLNGNSITSSNTSTTAGTLIVDGNSYAYTIVDATKKIIIMDLNGDGTQATALGQQYSYLVPKLITSGQGGLYFYNGNQTDTNTTTYVYPGVGFAGIRWIVSGGGTSDYTVTVSTYNSGSWTDETSTITVNSATASNKFNQTYTKNHIDYIVNCYNASIETVTCDVALGTSASSIKTSKGYILVEEAQQGSTTHNWIYLPIAWDATNSRVYINSPSSDDSNYANINLLGTQEYQGMTTYGTLVKYYTTTGGGSAEISYPDSFTYANLYVMGPEGTITTTTSESGETTTEKVVAVTADIAKLDTEITDADKANYDLVLVGGPCVNSLVSALAEEGKFAYTCDTWPAENFGWIELINDAFAEGKTALIVAGTRAEDTDLAARVVQDGTKLEGITASSAKVTGESFASVVVE
ncbi:MAG: S-layer protein [Candidatus Aenigmarchaeota archaeon]|nr:S-layer protein [Candidatus Aenigmarchaeota archaeon]